VTPIDSLRGAGALAGVTLPGAVPGAGAAGTSGFGDLVKAALDQASRAQSASTTLQQRYLAEDPTVGLEETMIAMQKASIGFQAVVQARNKLVAAYTEIMNMSV
jgi:flagellar hook-basal body complex protein FliE